MNGLHSFDELRRSLNNEPYVVQIYFAYETDYLCGLSTFGRKIEWMRANPKVGVKVRAVEYSVQAGDDWNANACFCLMNKNEVQGSRQLYRSISR